MFNVTDGLTVFQPQLGHLLRADPVSRDLGKEDGIYRDHGDRWSPALFDGDKVRLVSHYSCPLEVLFKWEGNARNPSTLRRGIHYQELQKRVLVDWLKQGTFVQNALT